MQDSAKYLIHADISATGVVERSDVVGAVFGQTEGLLGDELDLRTLQESGKLGRIDVEIESEGGASYGEITIASGLDRVETAILAAALESIERVGPCTASVEVRELEDVRSAKRREVVDRATELLADFEERTLTSEELVEEVRQRVRVEDITEYEGLPAGPRVVDSDAIIVVEGRADVLTLLQYGVKNAIAVEGTDVPDAVADLTDSRTVTAFLDGDRGGNLILRELAQVGDVDYVAFAPDDRSVEDLSRGQVMTALREKRPYESVPEEADSATAPADESGRAAPPEVAGEGPTGADADGEASSAATPHPDGTAGADVEAAESGDQTSDGTAEPTPASSAAVAEPTTGAGAESATGADAETAGNEAETALEGEVERAGDEAEAAVGPDAEAAVEAVEDEPQTLAGHVEAVISGDTGRVRLLDGAFETLSEADAGEAFEAVESADPAPTAVVLDGKLSQRILDVAAQRGVEQVVARSTGEFVKRPTDVRIRTVGDFAD